MGGRGGEARRALLQVCVNGAQVLSAHPALHADPDLAAADAARAVAAGARAIHVHPKDAEGRDSMSPDDVSRWIRAFREACPDTPLGVTTGAWIHPDVERRVHAIATWVERPDYASLNWHEAGAVRVADILHRRGIRIEAGIWNATGLAAWRESPLRAECIRVLVELPDEAAEVVRDHAEGLIAHVRAEEPDIAILLHGEGRSAWPALALAAELGLESRIGLEDTLVHPDGRPAHDNASLVRAATALIDGY